MATAHKAEIDELAHYLCLMGCCPKSWYLSAKYQSALIIKAFLLQEDERYWFTSRSQLLMKSQEEEEEEEGAAFLSAMKAAKYRFIFSAYHEILVIRNCS